MLLTFYIEFHRSSTYTEEHYEFSNEFIRILFYSFYFIHSILECVLIYRRLLPIVIAFILDSRDLLIRLKDCVD